jgi:signal recognition particle GTPase
VLTASDVEPILQEFSNNLTNKNVSAEIAQEICKLWKKELIDTKTASYTSIQ